MEVFLAALAAIGIFIGGPVLIGLLITGGVASSVFRRCKANSSDEGARICVTDTPTASCGEILFMSYGCF